MGKASSERQLSGPTDTGTESSEFSANDLSWNRMENKINSVFKIMKSSCSRIALTSSLFFLLTLIYFQGPISRSCLCTSSI